MIDKRLFLVLPALAVLAACGEGAADEGAAASGEVLEGTISDAMLPLDRVRSEPPLEDPEAFVEAQAEAAEEAGAVEESEEAEGEEGEPEAEEIDETPAATLTPAAAD